MFLTLIRKETQNQYGLQWALEEGFEAVLLFFSVARKKSHTSHYTESYYIQLAMQGNYYILYVVNVLKLSDVMVSPSSISFLGFASIANLNPYCILPYQT